MDAPPNPPRPGSPNRRTWIAIAVLVALWAVAMFFRWEIRTWWWGRRLASAETPQARGYYFACLASVGDRSLGAAERLLDHPSAEIRLQALAILHRCRSDRARPLLLRAMRDADLDVRESAALGLAAFGDEAVLPDLLRMLESSDENTVLAAVVALQRLGSPKALDALLRVAAGAAGGGAASVRAQAVDSLGLIGDRQAVPVLIDCLADERPVTTQPAAERAMRRAIQAMAGDLVKQGIDPASVANQPVPSTVADLAARALQRITGEPLGFRTTDPPDRKAAVIRMYSQWWDTHKGT